VAGERDCGETDGAADGFFFRDSLEGRERILGSKSTAFYTNVKHSLHIGKVGFCRKQDVKLIS
jgi:hypothetical protein